MGAEIDYIILQLWKEGVWWKYKPESICIQVIITAALLIRRINRTTMGLKY